MCCFLPLQTCWRGKEQLSARGVSQGNDDESRERRGGISSLKLGNSVLCMEYMCVRERQTDRCGARDREMAAGLVPSDLC